MRSFPLPFQRTALRLFPVVLPVLALLAAAPAVRADSITYDVTLSPTHGVYGGTGTVTLAAAPSASGLTTYSAANGQLKDLTFTIDGQTFSLSADKNALVEFLDGKLYDITFAQTVGSSSNRFTLDTSGVYAFYYNNGQSESSGALTAALAQVPSNPSTPPTPTTSPTPEPGSLLLLATALFAGGFFLFRRKRVAQS
jgi:hypothetical protein